MLKNTLKQDFINRSSWLNFKASTIYPLNIKNKSDFLICFPNYWKIKNKIKNMICCIKLYDNNGHKISSKIVNIYLHNEIYFSRIFKIKKFSGILEIDFQSTENLKFEFPGITGFYISPKKLISCVHSAGRLLSVNQNSSYDKISEETNFSLKFKKYTTTPFFSLFNSFIEKKNNKIVITLKNKDNDILAVKTLQKDIILPYSNKIFYLDNYFPEKILKKSEYCIVKTNASDVFPRMICGNYHRKLHHYEVTHSYPVIKNKKDVINLKKLNPEKYDCYSYLHFVKSKNSDLEIKIFPTNLKQKINSKLYIYDEKMKKLKFIKKVIFNSGSKMFNYNMDRNSNFGILKIKQKRIPSRINATYIYKNKNKNNLTSDIALAFKSVEYPVKRSHWGSFVLSNEIDTNLLMRKFSHKNENCYSEGYLDIYAGDKLIKRKKLKIKNDNYQILNMKEIAGVKTKEIKTYSWIATFSKNPEGVDFFSNIFSKKFMSGDHAF